MNIYNQKEPIMHKEYFNVIDKAIDMYSDDTVLNVYRHMSDLRKFEENVVKVAHTGKIKVKVHMSSGQEAVAAAIAETVPNYQIFTQHRSMDIYLALGGNPTMLRDEILCLDTGCCGGQIGGAFQIHNENINMFAHTGFIGENVSVGVGMALGNGQKTLCLFGDGAAEEDYVLEAIGFAATHHLPVLFVCTDNELSVLSPKKKRRNWELANVADGFGVRAIDIADDPFSLMKYFSEFDVALPALVNVRVCRNYWHAGVGIDNPPDWDRYYIVRKQMIDRKLRSQLKIIEDEATTKMEKLWKDYL